MISSYFKKPLGQFILSGLDNVPIVSFYAKTRGWPFVMAWIHRISGMLMVLYIWAHIYTLSSLAAPDNYDATMKLLSSFPFSFLEWLLAVPVIYHSINGGRLILYEIFDCRNDESMIHWVLGLSAIYFLLMGFIMLIGNQAVSPLFFWLITVIGGVIACYFVASKISNIAGSLTWKLQRITAAYLFVMIPAHFLFVHLQPQVGHEAAIVISRMQSFFIKSIDLTLLIGGLYHCGYGLISIIGDYLKHKLLQRSLAALIVFVMAFFGWTGTKIIIIL